MTTETTKVHAIHDDGRTRGTRLTDADTDARDLVVLAGRKLPGWMGGVAERTGYGRSVLCADDESARILSLQCGLHHGYEGDVTAHDRGADGVDLNAWLAASEAGRRILDGNRRNESH